MNSRWVLFFMLSYVFCISSWGQVAPTPTPDSPYPSITIDLPGLPVDATPLVMVKLPPGTFMMGDPRTGEKQVKFSDSFYLGKYEVTEAQWKAMGNILYEEKGHNYPVPFLGLDMCNDFFSRLNKLGQGYFRYPSEAEWEYACRAGTATCFFWGDNAGLDIASQYNWIGDESPSPHEIGLKIPNPWGFFDMNGNVSEWCQEYDKKPFFAKQVYHPSQLGFDPSHIYIICGEEVRMLPVGSYCRMGEEVYYYIDSRNVGFRLAMQPQAPHGTPTPTFTPTIPINYPTPAPTSTPLPSFIPNTQTISLTRNSKIDSFLDTVSYVNISSKSGIISPIIHTNFKADLSLETTSIDGDGDTLIHKGIAVSIVPEGIRIIQTPWSYLSSRVQLDFDGSKAAFLAKFLTIFDISIPNIISQFDPNYYYISKNLKTFACVYGSKQIFLIEYDGASFSKPVTLLPDVFVDDGGPGKAIVVSSEGTRVFFPGYTMPNPPERVYKNYFIERTKNGWEQKSLPQFMMGPFNFSYLKSEICDTATDGKCLLVWDRDETRNRGLAIIHQTETGWTEPEYLGAMIRSMLFMPQISEDGSVVAFFDLYPTMIYIFIRQQTGEWNKIVISDPGVAYINAIFLSKDGSRLFWAPYSKYPGIDTKEWLMQ